MVNRSWLYSKPPLCCSHEEYTTDCSGPQIEAGTAGWPGLCLFRGWMCRPGKHTCERTSDGSVARLPSEGCAQAQRPRLLSTSLHRIAGRLARVRASRRLGRRPSAAPSESDGEDKGWENVRPARVRPATRIRLLLLLLLLGPPPSNPRVVVARIDEPKGVGQDLGREGNEGRPGGACADCECARHCAGWGSRPWGRLRRRTA